MGEKRRWLTQSVEWRSVFMVPGFSPLGPGSRRRVKRTSGKTRGEAGLHHLAFVVGLVVGASVALAVRLVWASLRVWLARRGLLRRGRWSRTLCRWRRLRCRCRRRGSRRR